MRRSLIAFIGLVAVFFVLACASDGGPVAPARPQVLSVTPIADGGMAVDYDSRKEDGDLVLALVHKDAPEKDVTSTVLMDAGANRRHVFSRESLGDQIHARLHLVAILRQTNGEVVSTCRAK